jgi:hypothetical protein
MNTFPIGMKPSISKSDIQLGYITRYFVKFVSDTQIYEVDNTQYNIFVKNPFYTAIQLKWYITGQIEDIITPTGEVIKGTRQRNASSIDYYDKELPGLRFVLRNPLELYFGKQ